VLRVIARMNVGGPAQHVSLLSGGLDRRGFATLLVSGALGPGEGSMEGLATASGARLLVMPSLGPEIRPGADLVSLRRLVAIVRAYRPAIVHTHTAKAGLLGRLAALMTRPRPIIVHTFHGHVLEGYFTPRASTALTRVERWLGRRSDRLVTVSDAVSADLVRLGVAPRERFETIPLGLPLGRFVQVPASLGQQFRQELGLAQSDVLVTITGRLVPIKRVDVAISAVAHARSLGAPLVLAVVGDGPQRRALEDAAAEQRVPARFLGFRADLPAILAAADVALLTSDNEGTPVSLIEALAAGVPVVATAVGGVADVVVHGSGVLEARGDAEALGVALADFAADPAARAAAGERGRAHVLRQFDADVLVDRVELLYRHLLAH
jgi:glycosyltransferase involved in cell wall biosynthesis